MDANNRGRFAHHGFRKTAIAALLGAMALSACSGGGDGGGGAPSSAAVKPGQVSGVAFGGRFPIVGSTITLYAVGSSGYGGATALTPTDTTLHNVTDSSGNWSINFNCPAADTPIYAVATGGHSGSNSVNGGIVLSSLLGVCGDAGTPLPAKVDIDEVTTVASAYALNQFLSADGVQPGSPLSNTTGFNNAAALLVNLVDVVGGVAVSAAPDGSLPTVGAFGTPPTATINTLANILESCVDSSGPASDACTALFNDAKPAGGAAPTTTLQAILDIARDPGHNAAAIYSLLPANGPFGTSDTNLAAAPNDWTLVMQYVGSAGLPTTGAPFGVAIDAAGDAWVTVRSTSRSGKGWVVELSPAGIQNGPLTANAAVLMSPSDIAINGADGTGNVWFGNSSTSSAGNVIGLDNGGFPLPNDPFAAGVVNKPSTVAISHSGSILVLDTTTAVDPEFTVLASDGSGATNIPVNDAASPGEQFSPQFESIAVDDVGNVYIADQGASRLAVLSAADFTQEIAGSPFEDASLSKPGALVLDPSGNVWLGNGAANTVTEFTKSGSGFTASSFPFSSNPSAVAATGKTMAADGAGNIWIGLTTTTGGIARLASDGSSAAGSPYAAAVFPFSPGDLALDSSGNVWLTQGSTHLVAEIIGAAVPVVTPMSGLPKLPVDP